MKPLLFYGTDIKSKLQYENCLLFDWQYLLCVIPKWFVAGLLDGLGDCLPLYRILQRFKSEWEYIFPRLSTASCQKDIYTFHGMKS